MLYWPLSLYAHFGVKRIFVSADNETKNSACFRSYGSGNMWPYSAAFVFNKITHTTFRGEDSSLSSGVIVNTTRLISNAVLCLWAHFGPISSSFGPRSSKYCPHLCRRFSRYFTRGPKPILPMKREEYILFLKGYLMKYSNK